MSRDPLGLIWRCADNPSPVLTAEELKAIPRHALDRLKELGLVRQAATASHATCDACTEQHVEEVFRVQSPDGTVRFFMPCPEHGRVEVPRERLLQWTVDYLPLLEALAAALSTSPEPKEVMPGRAWNLGCAALAGKSRPIWVARGLAWPDAARVAEVLPRGRSPAIFYLGGSPDDGVLQVPRESIIELLAVVRLEGGNDVVVDCAAIESQLAIGGEEQPAKKPKKRASRTAAIDAVKGALREHLRAARDHAWSLLKQGRGAELLPRPSQKQLARLLDLSTSSVSRAINDPSDKEIRILWMAAKDINQVMRFKG